MRVSHAVQDRSPGRTLIGAGIGGDDRTRLNSFESCLDFSGTLITLQRFLGETALDDRPQAGRYRGTKQVRDFAHDGRADLESCAPLKWHTPGSGFIEHNPQGPQITAIIGRVATQDFGGHVWQSAAYVGCVLQSCKGPGGALEYPTAYLLR